MQPGIPSFYLHRMGTLWSGETLGRNEVQVQAVKRKREESDSYDDDNASGEDKTIQDELNTPKKYVK